MMELAYYEEVYCQILLDGAALLLGQPPREWNTLPLFCTDILIYEMTKGSEPVCPLYVSTLTDYTTEYRGRL